MKNDKLYSVKKSEAGSDLFLMKTYDLGVLYNQVKRVLKTENFHFQLLSARPQYKENMFDIFSAGKIIGHVKMDYDTYLPLSLINIYCEKQKEVENYLYQRGISRSA